MHIKDRERGMAKISEKVKKVSVAWEAATLNYFDVYQNTIIIGIGYVISYPDGRLASPELFDFSGNKLPEAWYQMKLTDYRPCIVARNIQ